MEKKELNWRMILVTQVLIILILIGLLLQVYKTKIELRENATKIVRQQKEAIDRCDYDRDMSQSKYNDAVSEKDWITSLINTKLSKECKAQLMEGEQ